jgi:hypothetical protein
MPRLPPKCISTRKPVSVQRSNLLNSSNFKVNFNKTFRNYSKLKDLISGLTFMFERLECLKNDDVKSL